MTKNNIKHPPPPAPVVQPGEGGGIQFPNKNDVLSGRGGRINNHEGNVYFRKLVASVKVKYLSKQTKKMDKAWIAADIVNQIRKLDPPGRFLKEDPNSSLWLEVGDERARRKTGQALREDAPDLREELEEADRSKIAMMAAQHPYMVPMAPGMYPAGYMPYPPGAMYYPHMYPPPHYPMAAGAMPPGSMPQAPGTMPQAATPCAPFPAPGMPYMYPGMYPVPMPPPTHLQTNKQAEVTTSSSTVNTGTNSSGKSNFTGVSDISADTKLLALMGSEEHQKKLELKEQHANNQRNAKDVKTSQGTPTQVPVSSLNSNVSQLTTDTQAMLLANLGSSTPGNGVLPTVSLSSAVGGIPTALPIGNFNSQTSQTNMQTSLSTNSNSPSGIKTALPVGNITNQIGVTNPPVHSNNSGIIKTSSTQSDKTESTVSSMEYQHNIQVPIKDPTPPKDHSSRRNQWREQLKQNVSQFSDLVKQADPKKEMKEFLPMDEDNPSQNLRFSNTSSNKDSRSSSSTTKSSVRFSNAYLFSSSVMSELSLASQNLGKEPHQSFRKSMSMTDLDAHSHNHDFDSTRYAIHGGATPMEDCHASTTMDKSMAESTTCSWMKGYNPVSSDLNPWISESNRSMFSEISMDLLALDLAGEKTSSITHAGGGTRHAV